MIPQHHHLWVLLLLAFGLSACTEQSVSVGNVDAYFTQKDDDDDDVCDPSEDDYDPSDPRCKPEGPGGTGVEPAEECVGMNNPTCNRAQEYPRQENLTVTNSSNIVFNGVTVSLELAPTSAGIIDTDGDTVPDSADECPGIGWRLPCDADASDDGLYQTMYYGSQGQYTLGADINVDGKISTADVYILMDATGSMVGEQKQLVTDLIKGTFTDTTDCPEGADTGLVGALKCAVDDVWMGLGQFNEVPLAPHGHPYRYTPYHHHLDTTDNLQHLLDAVSALTTTFNRDHPESATMAMYSIATGQGLGSWVPNRTGCPEGHWGYPCFRPKALPIIMLFTDAEMFNGPRLASPTYGNPPFDGTVGLPDFLPPVEQDPAMLYSSTLADAHDLGDLSAKSVSVMGTNVNFGNNVPSWNLTGCRVCSGTPEVCWGDGRDGIVTFSVDSAFEAGGGQAFINGEGSFYHYTKISLWDQTLTNVACDIGPGGGNWWGRVLEPLTAGQWYVASDAAVSPKSSEASNIGPFQIRIQTTPADPSWETKQVPVDWSEVETELLASAIKTVSIVSPGDNGFVAKPDAEALGVLTGSVDQDGVPYLSEIQGNGTGLTTGILEAVQALVGNTRRDITVVAEDNPATPLVDESRFVQQIIAAQCPTTGNFNCLGGEGTDTCEGCLADSDLRFEFRVGNDFVAPTGVDQVFDFDLVSLADGNVELRRIPLRVMVPALGPGFGDGYYEQTYDSNLNCVFDNERPDWGFLTWNGSTPSDSEIEFEVFTADFEEELNGLPATITVTDASVDTPIDVGQLLIQSGQTNLNLFVKIRAKLLASSDGNSTPTLAGWSFRYDCVPAL